MKKVFRIALIIILIAAFVGTLYYLYQKDRRAPVEYQTQNPEKKNIVVNTVATGKVVPRKEIEIKPQQVSGIIQTIYIEPGDRVKEGDLIAKIKVIPNMIQLNDAETRVKKAELNFQDAKKIYDRQLKVYEEGVISLAEFQRYETAYKESREEFSAAENHLQLIKEGVRKDDQEDESNTLIRSTIKGMVLDVPVEVGNSVIQTNNFNSGTTIAVVADMNDMIFEGKVDETEVGKIRTGMLISLNIGAIDDTRFDAILEYISPKGVEESGAIQFEIRANVKLKESFFIRSGYSANADIVLERRDSVMSIPESLVQFDEQDSAFVEVQTQPQQFEKRQVKLGLSDGIRIEIVSGLDYEDQIKMFIYLFRIAYKVDIERGLVR